MKKSLTDVEEANCKLKALRLLQCILGNILQGGRSSSWFFLHHCVCLFFFLQHVCFTPSVAAGLMRSLGFLYLCFCIPLQWARCCHGASSGGDGEEAEGAHRPPPGCSGAEDWDTSNERPAAGDHQGQHSGRTCLLQTSRDDSSSQSLSSSEGLIT